MNLLTIHLLCTMPKSPVSTTVKETAQPRRFSLWYRLRPIAQ
jgi:hypothetical protein